MATQFRIDVVVNPSRAVKGTKQVEKGLTSLEKKANKTQLLLRRAFAGIGVALVIRELADLGDTFTNLQNRLRVVTSGTTDLKNKTEELLQVANRSRSSFESTAELYSRMALATRELNLEGANLVKITESINKAIILSGASAKEANNGLIQLSQGLASGRLTGDELRSTLEQLPVVADVIAKELGVTRGELRKLGSEGKITSIKIIKAFQNAEEELDKGFGKTVPTLGQSLVVLRNNVVAFVGAINEGAGILRGFGAAIRFVGEELSAIAKTLAVIGATAASVQLAPIIKSFIALRAVTESVVAANAKSVAVIRLQNKLTLEQANITLAAAAAELKRTDGIIVQTRVEALRNAIKKGSIALTFQQTVVERQLEGVQAQRTAQLAALIAAEKSHAAAAAASAKSVNIFTQSMVRARLATSAFTKTLLANPFGAALVGLTAIVTTLVVFRKDIKLAGDRAATLGNLFSAAFDMIGQAFSAIREAFQRTFGGILEDVIAFFGGFKLNLANVIRFVVGFADAAVSIFLGLIGGILGAIASLPKNVSSIFKQMVNLTLDGLEFLPKAVVAIFSSLGEVVVTFVNGLRDSISQLGGVFDALKSGDFKGAFKAASAAADAAGDAFDGTFDKVPDIITKNFEDQFSKNLVPRLTVEAGTGMAGVAKGALDGFQKGFSFAGLSINLEKLFALADLKAADEAAADATEAKTAADKAANAEAQLRFTAIVKVRDALRAESIDLQNQINLGQREATIRKTQADIIAKLTKAGVTLNEVQKQELDTLTRKQTAQQEAIATGLQLVTVEEKLAERTRLANNAFDEGTISLQTYLLELQNIRLASAEAGTGLSDGITTGISTIKLRLEDLATTIDSVLVNGFEAAWDSVALGFQETFSFIAQNLKDGETSWVDYRDAITATFKSAIDSILSEIAKLIIQLLVLKAIQLATGTSPSGGLPTGSGPRGELTLAQIGVPGAATGTGAATANKPFLIGEEGPEIFTPGQTGSISPTDQTISALTSGAANQRETTVVQAPAPQVNLSTIVVDDPSKIPTGIESPEGRQAVRNVIRQDRSGIKQDLG